MGAQRRVLGDSNDDLSVALVHSYNQHEGMPTKRQRIGADSTKLFFDQFVQLPPRSTPKFSEGSQSLHSKLSDILFAVKQQNK